MPDNLYQQEEVPNSSLLQDLILPVAAFEGHRWTTGALIGRKARLSKEMGGLGIGKTGWVFEQREARRLANRASRQVWRGATSKGLGWDVGARWRAARLVSDLPASVELTGRGLAFRAATAGHRGGAAVAEKISGITSRMVTKRTVAGLLRVPLGAANAYFAVSSFAVPIAEGLVGGLSELQKFGARLRTSTPETSVGWQDVATRERAFTMRQASLMALHMSGSGARAALGEEASFLHS